MIHYDLVCDRGHEFDGWFPDSAGFDDQCRRALVLCPTCGSPEVRRGLMAPTIARGRQAAPDPRPAAPAAPAIPDAVRAGLQRLRAEVERRCAYVGDAFAEQARRMHRGEQDAAGIYGETTPDEARALAEEGVPFASIPWVAPADS